MKIRGEAVLELVNDITGERIPYGPPVLNNLGWSAFRNFWIANYAVAVPTKRDATSQPSPVLSRWSMYYGINDVYPTPMNSWYNHTAKINVDQDTPYWTDGATSADPDVMTFTATIPGPSTGQGARTIKVLGLSMDTDGLIDTNVFNRSLYAKFTVLRLTTPCVQPENYTLIVTYRLYFPPATAPATVRASSNVYTDFKRLMKLACQAVASVYYGSTSNSTYLGGTAWELDDLTTVSPRAVIAGNVLTSELTDGGMYQLISNAPLYHNLITASYNLSVSALPSLGMFTKYSIIGGEAVESGVDTGFHRMSAYTELVPSTLSPVQSIFKQRGNAPGPFQDKVVANTGTMTGTIALDTTSWVDPKYQKMMRIRISVSGDIATPARYFVDVMNFHAGFVGNRWVGRTALFPVTNSTLTDGYFRKATGEAIYETTPMSGGVVYRTDGIQNVLAVDGSRTKTGVSIYDVLLGKKRTFNASTTPALAVTAVCDGEYSGGFYYVACANTGLWRISSDFTTVQNVPNPVAGGANKAYQIAKKNDANGTLFVLFDGGLCKLTNPSAAVGSLTWTTYNTTSPTTFSFTGITNANWDKVTSMTIDPDATDDRLLFVTAGVAASSGNTYAAGYAWWKSSTGGAATSPTAGPGLLIASWTLAPLLAICDNIQVINGRWAAWENQYGQSIWHWVYGASTMDSSYVTSPSYGRPVATTINGQKGFLISWSGYSSGYPAVFVLATSLPLMSNGALLNISNTNIEFMLRKGTMDYTGALETTSGISGLLSSPLAYVAGCNQIFSWEDTQLSYGVTPFMLQVSHAKNATYSAAWWKTYGWDGSNWVLGGATGKPVHATSDTLPAMDGLKVSFTNGGSSPSFIANEWWVTAVGKGLLKDNGTTFVSTLSFVGGNDTAKITLSGTVPQTPLGALVDEPVTFTSTTPSNAGQTNSAGPTFWCSLLQNKGTVIQHPGSTSESLLAVSDQLIPANTDFDFRFRWISFEGSTDSMKACGIASGTGTYTYGPYFYYNPTLDTLYAYNGATLVGSVPRASLDPNADCRIVRTGTSVSMYYNGTLLGSAITSGVSGAYVIYIRGYDGDDESGWHHMRLTYTEARRVMRVGSSGSQTGCYSSRFMGLVSVSSVNATKVTIGNSPGLNAILDFTTAGVALTGTGRVKVAAGAGWLIFHNSEAANAVSGYSVVNYTPADF